MAVTYVQQIYVGQAARRLGVTQELMPGIARAAKAAGSTRIEWSTSTENTAARALYDGLGVSGSDKVYLYSKGPASKGWRREDSKAGRSGFQAKHTFRFPAWPITDCPLWRTPIRKADVQARCIHSLS